MTVGNEHELAGVLAAGRAVRAAFDVMKAAARAGISTAELDALGAAELDRAGARSAPRLFHDFPGATCISVNEQAAHGVPGARRLADGDIVNIDVSAELDGFVADMGESFVVGAGSRARQQICRAVASAVSAAIAAVRTGRSLNVIGAAVQRVARRSGYRIVRNLGSHGVGRHLHEEPSYVPFDNPRERRRLAEGLVLTIEPFFTTGPAWVEAGSDGWTLSVPRGELVAQCEHTVVVTRAGALVVTG
jgi:methionyl aminopeptidase